MNIEDKSLSNMKEGSQKAARAAKTTKKAIKIGKFLLKPLLPLLPILFIFSVIFLVILVIFWAAPQGGLYTTTAHTPEDDRLLAYYQELAQENNYYRWLVEGESTDPWHSTVSSNPNKYLVDRYGRDSALFETFGQIHTANILYVLSHHLKDTDDEFKSQIASDFKPYFYYKESSVTTCSTSEDGEKESSTSSVFLLVESYTIQGHYLYRYEWVTEGEETTITYERPTATTQISPNRWQRLDDWVEENYGLNNPDDIQMLRAAVFEGGKGYTEHSQALSWIMAEESDRFYLSQGFIPAQLMGHFSKVSEIFDIPAWFLAAIAYQESSFNVTAENSSGAYGLFQLMPATQKQEVEKLIKYYPYLLPQELLDRYTPDAAFYKEAVSDPYINTLCGALHLIDKGLIPSEIDWESAQWKNQTLPCLTSYGGFANIPESLWKKYNIASEDEARDKAYLWAKDEYASKIWKNAEQFLSKGTWPTEESPITAYFGEQGSYWTDTHTGVDFGVPTGTPIYAVTNAEVVFTGWNGPYGKCIIISNGWYTFLYGHLDSIDVTIGEKVTVGKIIGKSGNTGNTSGPHLHFEVRDNGVCIDPLIWLVKKI